MKTITRRNRWAILLALSCIATVALSQSETLIVAAFSALKAAAPLPEHWKPFGVSSATPRTRYTLVDDAGVTVVKAEANASASALSRDIKVNLADYPTLKWRWKISDLLKNSDISRPQIICNSAAKDGGNVK